MADLDAASLEDFANFFKTYYAPNNAVLAIAGDVDPKIALEKVRKYFEAIPSGPPAPPLDTTEPAQKEERRTIINDPLARLTLVDIAYQVPGGINPDMDALSRARDGDGLRPQLAAVRQPRPAAAGRRAGGRRRRAGEGPDVHVSRRHGRARERIRPQVEKAIYAEVEKIQKGPIQEWELDKARNAARRSLVGSLGSSLQRAILLSRYTVFYNDPGDHQHALRAHRVADDRGSAARRAPVSRAREPRGDRHRAREAEATGAPGAKAGGAQ